MLKNERFTLLVGSKQVEERNEYAFSVVYSNDENGLPAFMYQEIEGILAKNVNLPERCEEVIRKTLDASIEGTGKGVIYITDFNYSNDLSISKYAPIILNKLSQASIVDKEAYTNREWVDILKEFHIKDVTVVRDMVTMVYGTRDALRIEFDSEGCRLANLEEDTPTKLTYLNLLSKFFKIVKDAIFV